MKQPEKIKKIAMFSDIHLGRRSNSRIHNQDCLDFVNWFCDNIDDDVTHIAFLGDWYESRSAINIDTLEYSYKALHRLNSLEIPIFFCVGNHDLHRRSTREIHSVRMFGEFSNIQVIDEPKVIDNILFSPFIFDIEYPKLLEHIGCWAFMGHFEFKNFVLSGHTRLSEHGPDHKIFKDTKKVFSGHYHKRQFADNVVYIGNTFPMDFSDADDESRGFCTYFVAEDKYTFTDWKDCPKYHRTTLSKVIDGKWIPLPKMKVKCTIDSDLGYQEAAELRDAMIQGYNLRDFILEEDRATKQGLLEGDNSKVEELPEFSSIDELVMSQLKEVESSKSKINGDVLIEIYKSIVVESSEDNQDE